MGDAADRGAVPGVGVWPVEEKTVLPSGVGVGVGRCKGADAAGERGLGATGLWAGVSSDPREPPCPSSLLPLGASDSLNCSLFSWLSSVSPQGCLESGTDFEHLEVWSFLSKRQRALTPRGEGRALHSLQDVPRGMASSAFLGRGFSVSKAELLGSKDCKRLDCQRR